LNGMAGSNNLYVTAINNANNTNFINTDLTWDEVDDLAQNELDADYQDYAAKITGNGLYRGSVIITYSYKHTRTVTKSFQWRFGALLNSPTITFSAIGETTQFSNSQIMEV
jgi:hypothetical protein